MKSGPSRVNAPLEDNRERKARVLHRVLHRACALRFLLLFAPVRIRVASKRSEEAFTLHGLPVVCIVCYDLLYRMSAGDFFFVSSFSRCVLWPSLFHGRWRFLFFILNF